MTATRLRQLTFDTANPDLAEQFIGQAYGSTPTMRVAGPPRSDRPMVAVDQHAAGPLTHNDARFFPEISAQVNASDLVSIQAIHAGTTPRALQYAFRQRLDTTPLAYLRTVRLERVHQDLLAADPTTDTVTDIAARWGFWHHSHFAAHYRHAYGRTPKDTLHT